VHPNFAFLILPYTRLELPGWGLLFRTFKVGSIPHYPLWKDAPTKIIRDKWNGNLIKLNLANWSERHTYFLGRYYDLDLQLAMTQILQKGDRFVDIGANIGMITLHGAALVTDSGCVDSFEPHPESCRRLQEALEMNNIKHVRVHNLGLSDCPGKLTLSVITEHSGMATLATPSSEQKDLVSDAFEVSVVIGDSVIMQNSTPVKLIKIDVEGFEYRVLQGLKQTLETWRPIVITEVEKEWLNRAGTNRTELFEFMSRYGYSPYGLTTKRKFMRHHLSIVPIDKNNVEDAKFSDFLWTHSPSLGYEVLQPFIQN
jgi:FkbM family methyltransferase